METTLSNSVSWVVWQPVGRMRTLSFARVIRTWRCDRGSVCRSAAEGGWCVVLNDYWCGWNCSRSALIVSAALCTNVWAGSNMFYDKGATTSGKRRVCVWRVDGWWMLCVVVLVEWILFKNDAKISIAILIVGYDHFSANVRTQWNGTYALCMWVSRGWVTQEYDLSKGLKNNCFHYLISAAKQKSGLCLTPLC